MARPQSDRLRLAFFYGITLGEAEVPERIPYAREPQTAGCGERRRSYVSAVSKFSRYFGKSPERLSLEDVRAFQVHLGFVQSPMSESTSRTFGIKRTFVMGWKSANVSAAGRSPLPGRCAQKREREAADNRFQLGYPASPLDRCRQFRF